MAEKSPKKKSGKPTKKTEGHGQAGPPLRRQSADPEGRRRCSRAGVHRGHAGLEARRRAEAGRAHRARRSRRAQGSQVELTVLRHGGRRLVPVVPLLRAVRQGDVLSRHLAGPRPARRVQDAGGRATSTSTRTNRSTKRSSRSGWTRPANSRANASELRRRPSSYCHPSRATQQRWKGVGCGRLGDARTSSGTVSRSSRSTGRRSTTRSTSRCSASCKHVWTGLRNNDDVRVVVLTGAGEKAFCTGIDRHESIDEYLADPEGRQPPHRAGVDAVHVQRPG